MMWVDLSQPSLLNGIHPQFGIAGFKALKFEQSDYLKDNAGLNNKPIVERALSKINDLGVTDSFANVYMLGQLRCLGIYFSPVNFFFYETYDGHLTHMVAEVSNTPWNERHYYLVELEKKVNFKKVFSVSPFMNLDMDYHWATRVRNESILIHIENKKDNNVLFDATLRLKRQSLTKQGISAIFKQFPAMTWTIFRGIYIHAFKLFCKRVPFIGHSGSGS